MNTRWIRIAVASVMMGMMVHSAAWGADEEEDFSGRAAKTAARAGQAMSLDDAFKGLPAYKFGQSRLCCTVIQDAVLASVGKPERAAIMPRLIASLDAPGVTDDAKTFILWQLRTIGSDAAVPSLAKLLADPKHAHMARAALQHTGTPAADAALRNALASLQGEQLVGLCISIGERRDRQAVPALVKLMNGGEEPVRAAAAAALGRIADKASADALLDARSSASAALKPAVLDAALACAERQLASGNAADATTIYQQLYKSDEPAPVRIAALRGLARAGAPEAVELVVQALQSTEPAWQSAGAQCIADIKGPQAAAAFVALLPKLAPPAQAQVVSALASQGAKAALPAALNLAASDNAAVRAAAIEVVGKLGDASVLPTLLQAASTRGTAQDAARSALDKLAGDGISPAMIAMLETAPPAGKVELIRSLAARGTTSAIPAMLKAAADNDLAVRVQVYRSLEELATANEAAALVALLPGVKDGAERTAAENATVAASRKLADTDAASASALAAYGNASVETKGSILRILARLQGPKAMDALRAAVKDTNAEISDTAIRAMISANDQALAADLLALAKDAPRPNQKILALRGYITLAGDKSLRDPEKLKRLTAALPLATRPDEKRLVLSALGAIPSAAALKVVEPHLADPDLSQEACIAAVNIAKKLKGDPVTVKQVMQKVVATAKDEKLKKEAATLAGR